MATTDTGASAPASATPLSTIMAVLLVGGLATVAFDMFGQALSPLAGYAKLAPVGLAQGAIKHFFGAVPKGSGELLHFITGMIAYPIGWLLIARPIADRITPGIPKILVAIIYGIGLWIFALYLMAHLVVGMPAFLGFTGITWVALVGHILYAVVFFAGWEWLKRRLA